MKKLLSAFLLLSVVLVSCKKEKVTYPIEGYWVGKYGSGTATPSSGYSMVVEPGGLVTVADGSSITSGSKAAGTWTLTGNTFKATYTYGGGGSTFSITATFSNDGKLTNGTWGPGTSTSGSGTWYMDRKN
ncbi:MAG: hypothetical protein U0T11_02115 [Chitinophagaceae bacterium]